MAIVRNTTIVEDYLFDYDYTFKDRDDEDGYHHITFLRKNTSPDAAVIRIPKFRVHLICSDHGVYVKCTALDFAVNEDESRRDAVMRYFNIINQHTKIACFFINPDNGEVSSSMYIDTLDAPLTEKRLNTVLMNVFAQFERYLAGAVMYSRGIDIDPFRLYEDCTNK